MMFRLCPVSVNPVPVLWRTPNTKHGHELSATIAAEVVLAVIERQGMVVMQKPSLPLPGVAPQET